MRYYNVPSISQAVYDILICIKENDGYIGQITPEKRSLILPYATVELSPSGLDMQWTLTADAKKSMMKFRSDQRWRAKYGHVRHHGYEPRERDAPVPLTIDVLDALKSIRETGEPGTQKIEVLARIQRYGVHAAKFKDGRWVDGALAEYKDGIWKLTGAGQYVEAGHIRKSECAQFTGKVR